MSSIYFNKYLHAPLKVFYDQAYKYLFEDEVTNNNIERIYSELTLSQKIISWFSEPTHIIDNIYLGSAYNAASYYSLKEKNIKLILNITNSISKYYPDYFDYIKYELNDNNNDNISNYLISSYIDIKGYQKKYPDNNILIHCFAGASRSASVVLYYIIKENKKKNPNYDLNDALDFLKKKRIIVNPTFKFFKELETITKIG